MRRARVLPGQASFFEPPTPDLLSTPPEDEAPLRGLTLWQPWAYAVLHLGKRLENRPWKPWPSMVGPWFALHAAARRKPSEEAWVLDRIAALTGKPAPGPGALVRGAVLGFGRLSGFVEASDDPWFLGPEYEGKKNYGWLLPDVVALPTPVPCKGYYGFWPVPAEALPAVRSAARGVGLAL